MSYEGPGPLDACRLAPMFLGHNSESIRCFSIFRILLRLLSQFCGYTSTLRCIPSIKRGRSGEQFPPANEYIRLSMDIIMASN